MLAFYLLCAVTAMWLAALNGNNDDLLEGLGLTVAFTAFMVVGALLVARVPGNAVGWIFSGIGLLTGTGSLAQEYAQYGYVTDPGSLPLPIVAAWYANWWWWSFLGLVFVFTLLFFPTGALPSRRWRPALWIATVGLVGITVLGMLTPTIRLQEVRDFTIRNPIGVPAVGNGVEGSVLGGVFFAFFLLSIVLAFASLVVRFRHSRGHERQQLKWFTYSGFVVLLVPPAENLPEPLGGALFVIAVTFIPLSAGIAILKYRLYDIDLVINRTLVYGSLTALLGLAYLGLVTGISSVAGDSPITVAASTLAVAALFRPLRARIQGFIDRRFYRKKYDAQRTIEEFSARLRDEVSLDSLSEHLLEVVEDTMQPATASLWLREPARAQPEG